MNFRNEQWKKSIQLINELQLGRLGMPKEIADKWIKEMEEAKVDTMIRIYPETLRFGKAIPISFDKHLLELFRDDKRIKNYKWWYARRRSRLIPVEKYLQVYDVIIDYLKGVSR